MKIISTNKFYNDVIRRNKNDIVDHFKSDISRKETLPKYISAIDKKFIYVKPKTGKQHISEKIIKFDFPGRDTLSIARENKEITSKTQLNGVNTNDMNIIETSEYEGISDEDNLFHLIYLSPLEEVNNNDEHFEFNRWWLGSTPNQSTPVGGSLTKEKIQNNAQITSKLGIKEGIIQTKKLLVVEDIVQISEEQKKVNKEILVKKTELNKFTLKF